MYSIQNTLLHTDKKILKMKLNGMYKPPEYLWFKNEDVDKSVLYVLKTLTEQDNKRMGRWLPDVLHSKQPIEISTIDQSTTLENLKCKIDNVPAVNYNDLYILRYAIETLNELIKNIIGKLKLTLDIDRVWKNIFERMSRTLETWGDMLHVANTEQTVWVSYKKTRNAATRIVLKSVNVLHAFLLHGTKNVPAHDCHMFSEFLKTMLLIDVNFADTFMYYEMYQRSLVDNITNIDKYISLCIVSKNKKMAFTVDDMKTYLLYPVFDSGGTVTRIKHVAPRERKHRKFWITAFASFLTHKTLIDHILQWKATNFPPEPIPNGSLDKQRIASLIDRQVDTSKKLSEFETSSLDVLSKIADKSNSTQMYYILLDTVCMKHMILLYM